MCWRTRGERGGGGTHSWTELLASNPLTTECCVSHTLWSLWVSNQVCNRGKTQIVSLFFFLSVHSELGSSVGRALVKLSISFPSCSHIPFLPLTHTPAVSFVSPKPPPPSFFSFHYIFISLSWESAPPHRWKGAGSRHTGGKHFNSESKLSRGQRHSPLIG